MSRIRVILLLMSAILHLEGLSQALTNGDLRLAGVGSNRFAGRLEVFYNDQWGTVCGGRPDQFFLSNFELRAANVACRQLGLGHAVDFFSALNLPEQRYRFGRAEGDIFLSAVTCQENHAHILQCTFGQIGPEAPSHGRCDHSMDVSLQCSNNSSPYNGEIRLVPMDATPTSQSPSSGSLELYSNGLWRGVCLQGVTTPTATTLCRQLGYTEVEIETIPGSLTSNVWAMTLPNSCDADSTCIGSCLNNDLPRLPGSPCQTVNLHCSFNRNIAEFDDISDIRSSCAIPPQPTPQKSVRLVANTASSVRSRVDVFVGGAWGTLCSTKFSLREARVVCKQAGFSNALTISDVSTASNGDVSGGSGEVYFLSCRTGVESHLSQCSLDLTGSGQCDTHNHDVTVQCSNVITPYGSVTLHGPQDQVVGASGTLVLFTGQLFQPVCDAGFGNLEARVVCRQLGYFDGVAIPNSFFGLNAGRDTSLNMVRLTGTCSGAESQLLSCGSGPEPFTDATGPDCRGGFDEVGVQCFFEDAQATVDSEVNFRLYGGERAEHGRLQVEYNGQWGRVCGEGFGWNEGLAFCKSLGFKSLLMVERREALSLPVYLSDVSCYGVEATPLHCNSSLSGTSQCPQDDQDIWMECSSSSLPTDGSLRLVGGDSSQSGRLEIQQNKMWLSVCGSRFTAEAAEVACRQLGFAVAANYCTNACFGEGTNVYFADDQCTGNETSLSECHMERYHPRLCNRSTVVGLYCDERITVPTAPSTLPSSTSKPSGLPMYVYYIIAGVGSAVVLLIVVVATIGCIFCCHRRWRRKHEGTWTSAYNQRNRPNQNGHSYHNGVVGDMNTMAKEKEGGFDDPLELNGTLPSPYPHTLPEHHHDVILHALNHAHDDDRDQYIAPKTKVKAQKPRSNGYHVGNGSVPNGIGMGHRHSASLSPTSSGSPTCPPPDYNELFRAESATPIQQANGCHSNGHANGCHVDKRDLCKGSDGEDIEKGRV